jgi:hypothetical protein
MIIFESLTCKYFIIKYFVKRFDCFYKICSIITLRIYNRLIFAKLKNEIVFICSKAPILLAFLDCSSYFWIVTLDTFYETIYDRINFLKLVNSTLKSYRASFWL